MVLGQTMVCSGCTADERGCGPHEKGLVRPREGALLANIKAHMAGKMLAAMSSRSWDLLKETFLECNLLEDGAH